MRALDADNSHKFDALDALNDGTASVADVVSFYTDLLNQMVELDRALIGGFLASKNLTDGQRLAIERWGASMEAIVECAIDKHFRMGGKLL